MMRAMLHSVFVAAVCTAFAGTAEWKIDSAAQWEQAAAKSDGLSYEDGFARPAGKTASYRSVVKRFPDKRSAKSIVFEQSPDWLNWTPIQSVGPSNLQDAPVFLALGPDNYWMFGLYRPAKGATGFTSEKVELDGFDVPLLTTPFPNQFDAPGGLKEGLGGYHAWQSRDMANWVHHGPVTEEFSRWVTTAEHVDGKTYIYYDYPNDQDPHLYIDDDLTDGVPGEDMGLAFKDPSDGSDCAIIRDPSGKFHVIYEDWSPIDASKHSWDSPLAGHAVSDDGLSDFKILPYAVDERTTPTGKYAEYPHPHWHQAKPDEFPAKMTHDEWKWSKKGTKYAVGRYEIHEPEQNAFGDWAAISIGGQYYLFCDYHPVHEKIRIAWFTSSGIDKPFSFCGEIGEGHPDPDIGFAEGKFYLINQTEQDYISPGPWVDTVTARAGVDTDNDGKIDQWTDWQNVSEKYGYTKGFAKQITRAPAALDLSLLPAGYGFAFEFRTEHTSGNDARPVLDRVVLTLD